MPKVTVVARVKAKSGKEDAVERELLALVRETRKEAGCINYDLHRSADDSTVFLFYENWESLDHLNRHAESAHIKALRTKAAAEELLDAPTQITLWQMLSEKGT